MTFPSSTWWGLIPGVNEVKSDGLGYQPAADWTPGIGLARIFDNSKFVVSIAPFIDNELLLPDGRSYVGK